jgi:hypothetical protein
MSVTATIRTQFKLTLFRILEFAAGNVNVETVSDLG